MQVEVGGRRVEVEDRPGTAVGAPPLVLLHEGLGCVALWRDLPERLAGATGSRVVTWSRYGHGGSEVLEGHREPGYMHDEALLALPELRDTLGVGRPVLVGHSDGTSIALIHAGARRWPVAGVVLLAPHVFVEEACLAGIAGARRSYRDTDLRQRLARYHRDPDATFYGWADVWLSEAFTAWNVEDSLAGVDCPVLVVQGTEDPYGTLAQVDAVEAGV
ncbi:MAG TPA: alpha/beta hydrolase, partial [Acidimicrobiales bacterium]|nr:alpha/beta hydrolase [Acidimicrobiales bacterium]